MKKKFWTSDKIVSFAAIGISIFTLFIFVKQTNIIEEQSHLSVMPYLLMETANNGENKTFSIEIVNYGVGPAIIESRIIYFQDKEYDLEFVDFLNNHIPNTDSIKVINNSTLQKGFALPAGASRNLIKVGGDDYSYQNFLKIMQTIQSDSFNYKIRYKSIYGDRWMISAETNAPVELED